MLVLWFVGPALAAEPCPDVAGLIDQAWSAFDDAELERADERLSAAQASLSCQTAPVATADLLELWRLDALVALSQQDRQGAVYASIRAVVVEPGSSPPSEYGPELAELHATWSSRLAENPVQVRVQGAGEAWVDGHPVVRDAPRKVLPGEHLLQWRDQEGIFHSEVRDLAAAHTIVTGPAVEDIEDPDELDPDDPDELDPDDPDDPDRPRDPKPPKEPRSGGGGGRRVALLTAGGVGVLGGGGAIAYAWTQESAFLASAYDADQYGPCASGSACYESARQQEIQADAQQIRAMYAIGYAASGLGVALVGTELLLLPTPTGARIGVRFAW